MKKIFILALCLVGFSVSSWAGGSAVVAQRIKDAGYGDGAFSGGGFFAFSTDNQVNNGSQNGGLSATPNL